MKWAKLSQWRRSGDWLLGIRLDWKTFGATNFSTHKVDVAKSDIRERYPGLFKTEPGKLKGFQAHLVVEENATPVYCKPRHTSYYMRGKLDEEYKRLMEAGIVEPVRYSEWASPPVPVLKRDGSVRVCGDYKVTINPVMKTEVYPLPTPDDLFTKLEGGVIFAKLDLSHAYQQIELDEASQELMVLNTHQGLLKYKRLNFGVSSATAIFQRAIEGVLCEVPSTAVYLDDVIVTGASEAEYVKNLHSVLAKLENAGLTLKENKCQFGMKEVEYLGYKVSAEGLETLPERIRPIMEAPSPTDCTELKSYLGMITYYNRFLPNISTVLEPLHELLRSDVKWEWSEEREKAFQLSKQILKDSPVLTHYDPKKPIVVSCDASPYGIGGMISHIVGGVEKPITCVSRKLNSAERRYSQLDKEGLAVVFTVKKFHKYLEGRKFKIQTDHKPLLGLLGEKKPIPTLASPRVQRWAITLSAYDYELVYRKGSDHANADCMSRLPLPETVVEVPIPGDTIHVLDLLNCTPVTADKIREWTRADPVLSQVKALLEQGWPEGVKSSELSAYYSRRVELSLQDGIILWGNRVVIPGPGRAMILEQLHETHAGASRMKSLARCYVYWPGIDQEIESMASGCDSCLKFRNSPQSTVMHPWEWPEKPWSRLHADFAGPFLGHMFLIIVDAHSKWLDVYVMNTITAEATMERLRTCFSIYGLPDILVTDNGATFTSEQFRMFMQTNGILHKTSPPYHPASNGLAERAVQTFKTCMKKLVGGSIHSRVNKFLFQYRVTPQTTTGQTPSELLMGRKIKCPFDLVRPNVNSRIWSKQYDQKSTHDKHSTHREFEEGDQVFYKNFASKGTPNLPGVITERKSSSDYIIRDKSSGISVRRHPDHVFLGDSLTPRSGNESVQVRAADSHNAENPHFRIQGNMRPPADPPDKFQTHESVAPCAPAVTTDNPGSATGPVRRSTRSTKGVPPQRMDC